MNKPELIYSFIKGLGLENQFPSVFCYLRNGKMGIIKDCLIYTYNDNFYISSGFKFTDYKKSLFFTSKKDALIYSQTGDDSLSIVKIINQGDYRQTFGDYDKFKFDNND